MNTLLILTTTKKNKTSNPQEAVLWGMTHDVTSEYLWLVPLPMTVWGGEISRVLKKIPAAHAE